MAYYVCTYGNFDGRDEMFQRTLREGRYFLHPSARYPSAIDMIRNGDVILLNAWGCIMAFGTARGSVVHNLADEWSHYIEVDQWTSYDKNNAMVGYSSYGIAKATIVGGQYSVVKKVDPKWAVKQLREMKLLEEVGVMKRDFFQLGLADVAAWFHDDLVNDSGVEAGIPILQRGHVWTAQQDELLWDSLMRRIPVGALVLCPAISAQNKGAVCTHHILDGQQRCTAIAAGFDRSPFKEENVDCANKRVLWYDLKPNKQELAKTSRRYVVRVTTPAHPWGYCLSDAAGSAACLGCEEIRRAKKSRMKEGWRPSSCGHFRPHTSEIYPLYAELPIPLGYLTHAYLEVKSLKAKVEEGPFWRGVEDVLINEKGFPFLDLKEKIRAFLSSSVEEDCILRHNAFVGIANAMEYVMIAVNAPQEVVDGEETANGEDSVEHLFTRINRQGTRLEGEELIYSSIKAYWPEVQEGIDAAANKRMPASRMLRIALQLSETQHARTFREAISLRDVRQISGTRDDYEASGGRAQKLIECELAGLCEVVDRWLVSGIKNHLPRVLKTAVANNAPEVYVLLLLLAQTMPSMSGDFIFSLALYLYFFDYRSRKSRRVLVVRNIINACYRDGFSEDTIRLAIRECQEHQENGGWLIPIIELSSVTEELEKCAYCLENIPEGTNWWTCFERFRCNRELLLLAETGYIDATFPEYDPAKKELWAEHNRPWDYDHVVPQKIVNGWGDADTNSWWLWCMGNMAAIPLEENRRKSDNPTLEYYNEMSGMFPVLDVSDFGVFYRCKPDLVEFRRLVWRRFLKIYQGLFDIVKTFKV